jgi:hypothetical protein
MSVQLPVTATVTTKLGDCCHDELDRQDNDLTRPGASRMRHANWPKVETSMIKAFMREFDTNQKDPNWKIRCMGYGSVCFPEFIGGFNR